MQAQNNVIIPEEHEVLQAMVADNFINNELGQIDMARVKSEDNGAAWSQTVNKEATRLYNRIFSSGNTANPHVSIPISWGHFFHYSIAKAEQFLLDKIPTANRHCFLT